MKRTVIKPIVTKSEKVAVDHATSTTMVEEEEMLKEPLSPKSTMFLLGTPSPHIIVTVGFDSPLVVETFKEKLPLALLKHPRFSSILVGDVLKKREDVRWVRVKHVNMDDHIIVPSINPALHENRLEADKFVEDYINNLSTTSLKDDISKPLWEFHVLNLKTSDAEAIGIYRIHHSLGDGASLTALLLSCTRQLANPDALPTFPTPTKKEKEKSLFLVVWWWLQVFCNTIFGVFMFLATTIYLKDSDVLMVGADPGIIKPRRFVRRTINLDDVKLVKNAIDATVNDVVLGMIEAGFSKYLVTRFDDKAEGKAKNFLKNIRIRMALVFNLRSFSGVQNLADMVGKDGKVKWGNQIGIVLIPLSIRLPNDPLDYVRKVKAKVDAKKRSLEAQYSLKIGNFAMKWFGIKGALIMSAKALQHSSIIVSNIPGPVEATGFYGNPIKFIAPSLYGFRNPVIINLRVT